MGAFQPLNVDQFIEAAPDPELTDVAALLDLDRPIERVAGDLRRRESGRGHMDVSDCGLPEVGSDTNGQGWKALFDESWIQPFLQEEDQ